jgi:hypothetical protein
MLGRLTNLNLVASRAPVEAGCDNLYIEVDSVGVSGHALALLAAKVRQDPSVFDALWHHVC